MLTRIEIDGFKSFLDFTLDVPPFLALVGPDASGESNLLDALAFAREAIGATCRTSEVARTRCSTRGGACPRSSSTSRRAARRCRGSPSGWRLR